MLRLRFSSGFILGLVLGIPAGAVVALLFAPAPAPADHAATATALQIQDLTHKLEVAKEDRQRVDKQFEQFQKLAEQMTASFNSLDQRFKALQEEQRLREAQPKPAAAPVAPVPAAQAPTLQQATAPAAPAAPDAPVPAIQARPAENGEPARDPESQ